MAGEEFVTVGWFEWVIGGLVAAAVLALSALTRKTSNMVTREQMDARYAQLAAQLAEHSVDDQERFDEMHKMIDKKQEEIAQAFYRFETRMGRQHEDIVQRMEAAATRTQDLILRLTRGEVE